MATEPKTPPSYRSEIRMIHLPWAGSIEIMSSELGLWGICNVGVWAPPIGCFYGEIGDLIVTAGKVAVRIPMLSLMLRPPAARVPVGGNDAHQVMQAMTSTFPVRGLRAEAGTTVLLEHVTSVARGAFGDETLVTALPPTGGPPPPFHVELAGALRVDTKGAK